MSAKLIQPGASFVLKLRRLGQASDRVWAVDSVYECAGRPGDKVDEIAGGSTDCDTYNLIHIKGDLYEVREKLTQKTFNIGVSNHSGRGEELCTPSFEHQ